MSTELVTGQPSTTQEGQLLVQQKANVPMIANPAMVAVDENIPEYMRGVATKGEDNLRQYVRPPLVKIVQGQSKQELKRQFGESAVIASPSGVIISEAIAKDAKESVWVRFVPLFIYTEYIAWNPLNSGIDLPSIRERTINPNTDLARRCESRDEKIREYPCPEVEAAGKYSGKEKVRCQSHINVIMCLLDHPTLAGEPILMSFTRTSHGQGRTLSNQILTRKGWPMHGTIYEFNVKPDSRKGFDFYTPQVQAHVMEGGIIGFLDPTWFEYTTQQAEMLLENYKNGMLQASYDEEAEATAGTTEVQVRAPANNF